MGEDGQLDNANVKDWISGFEDRMTATGIVWKTKNTRFWLTWSVSESKPEDNLSIGVFEALKSHMEKSGIDVIALSEKKEREYTACSIYGLECAKPIFTNISNVCYLGAGSTKSHVTRTRKMSPIEWRNLKTVSGSESKKFGKEQDEFEKVGITMPNDTDKIYCARIRRRDEVIECHEIKTVMKLSKYWKKSHWGRWATVVFNDKEQPADITGNTRRDSSLSGHPFNCHFERGYMYLWKSTSRNEFLKDFKKCEDEQQRRRTIVHAAKENGNDATQPLLGLHNASQGVGHRFGSKGGLNRRRMTQRDPDHRDSAVKAPEMIRRRMAQREFSDRRDSPVMTRLLEDIVAAQDD